MAPPEAPRRGTSIRIFLADGSPDGLRIVEKSNWTGRAILCSRAQYPEARGRDEFGRPGVYVLVGSAQRGGTQGRVYVGEADLARVRLGGSGARGEGRDTPEGFLVLAGAIARKDEVPSIHRYTSELRSQTVRSTRQSSRAIRTGSRGAVSVFRAFCDFLGIESVLRSWV